MTDASLGIAVRADVTDLRANLALANQDLRAHNAVVRELAQAASEASGAMRDQLVQQLKSATVETAHSTAEVAKLRGELNGLGEERGALAVFDGIRGRLASLTELGGEFRELGESVIAAFAVERVAEWVDEIVEAGAKVQHLSQELGMSAEEISKFGLVAQSMGVGIDEAASLLEKLERNSVEAATGTGKAAAAFAALGISANQLKSMSPTDMINAIADAFAKTADGPTKTAIAIDLMGRAGTDMIPILDQGRAGLEAFYERVRATGAIISPDLAESMEGASVNISLMKDSFTGLKDTLYGSLEPAIDGTIATITQATENFNAWMTKTKSGAVTLQALVLTVDDVVFATETFSFAVKESYDVASGAWTAMGDDASAVAVVLEDVFEMKWSRIGHDWKISSLQMAADNATMLTKMADDATEYAASVKALYAGFGKPPPPPAGAPDGKPPLKPPASTDDGQDMAAWQATLDAKLMSEQAFGQKAKQVELDYWESVVANVIGYGAKEVSERNEIYAKIYSLESEMHSKMASLASEAARKALEAAKKAAEEKNEVEREQLTTNLTIAKLGLEAQEQSLDAEVSAGRITAAQKIGIEENLAGQKLILDMQQVQSEIDAGSLSTVQLAAEYDKKRVILAQYFLDMQKMGNQYALAQAKEQTDSAKQWQDSLQPIGRAFDGMLEGMLEHRESFNEAMLKLSTQLVNSLIADGTKDLIHFASIQLAKTTSNAAGVASRNATDAAGAAAGKATEAASGSSYVLGNAYKAASGAYAALAGIPVVGPILAPIAAGTAFAAVAAFDVFSAEGGMERVPYDNAPALLHANEMVLPAHLANPLRDMVSGGTSNTFGSSTSHSFTMGDVHVHPEAGSKMTPGDILKVIKNAHRNNAFA